MRPQRLLAAAMLASLIGGLAQAQTPPSSMAPAEAVFAQQEAAPASDSKALSDRAYADLGKGDYKGALAALRTADAKAVFEGPRFVYLPQLAYLEWKTGNEAAARSYVSQALAAYELVNGTAACPDDSEYANPSARLAGLGDKLTAAEAREVMGRVCSVFLEGFVKRDRQWDLDGLYLTKLMTVRGLLD